MALEEHLNFCFPLRVLANDRVKLVLFEVRSILASNQCSFALMV
jgi:hypothetical protein